MNGKHVVITGGTDGIGKVTARELARLGAAVTLVARSPDKAKSVVDELRDVSGNRQVDFVAADLTEQRQVHACADELAARLPRVDVLINNAGAIFERRLLTPDGIECTLALNHLAYFLLTVRLKRLLAAAPAARIVNVASAAHRGAPLALDDLQHERSYSGWVAYGRSKLANVLFTYELARRLAGSSITANCLHPGFVASRFGDNTSGWLRTLIGAAKRVFAVSEDKGALTSIYLASSPDVANVSGKYFEKCRAVKSSAASYDEAAAKRLWTESERLTRCTFE